MSPRTVLPLPATSFHILLALMDGPAHGYGIKHVVEERTEGRIRLAAGTLYEAMQRLARQGMVEDAPAPDDFDGSGRVRFYSITELGATELRTELARLEQDVAFARARIPAER
ncbi:MAG: PadR family transcriptional regulator [Acidobacteria bacterium]|nr:PadR family transcriptional regulator [Acidobacteriota bacterium]